MLRVWVTVFLVLLAGCSRPLAPGERALADDIFGPSLDVDRVRVGQGFGPLPKLQSLPDLPEVKKIKTRPGICDRTAPSPPDGPPPAWAIYNKVYFSGEFYRADTTPDWPGRVLIPQVLILAHELVHVWQWQNRGHTGYRPAKAGLESLLNRDPYFYVPGEDAGFLEYGFEQQATMVEDYLCYGLFDPANPRRAKLRAILAPHFRVDRIDAVLAR
jgi:hypothetical protein